MDRPTCETCAYYDKDGHPYQGMGHCHWAPTGNGQAYMAFKEVYIFQWCGQHHLFPAYLASLKHDGKPNS